MAIVTDSTGRARGVKSVARAPYLAMTGAISHATHKWTLFVRAFATTTKRQNRGSGGEGCGVSYWAEGAGRGVEIKEMISCMSYACPLIASGARSKK